MPGIPIQFEREQKVNCGSGDAAGSASVLRRGAGPRPSNWSGLQVLFRFHVRSKANDILGLFVGETPRGPPNALSYSLSHSTGCNSGCLVPSPREVPPAKKTSTCGREKGAKEDASNKTLRTLSSRKLVRLAPRERTKTKHQNEKERILATSVPERHPPPSSLPPKRPWAELRPEARLQLSPSHKDPPKTLGTRSTRTFDPGLGPPSLSQIPWEGQLGMDAGCAIMALCRAPPYPGPVNEYDECQMIKQIWETS